MNPQQEKDIIILAIESSCDDTGASVIRNGEVLSNKIATQKVHEQYGGVIPEMASRVHMQNIVPVVDVALNEAGVALHQLSAVAFTQSPGLIGSLMVGACFAKSLAMSLNVPLIAVQHMQAHVLANFIREPRPDFPFLCLTVSGGHTQIVKVNSPLQMEVIGETIDDAAGEAYDKAAKMLGLPYPGGPLIDTYARLGDPLRFRFSEPNIAELDFSFSGVKTSILYFLRDETAKDPEFVQNNLNDICAAIQHRIVGILLKKLHKASKATGIKSVSLAGGVSANSALREGLKEYAGNHGWQYYIPDFEFCTDNAAMIAMTAHYKFLEGEFSDLSVAPSPRSMF